MIKMKENLILDTKECNEVLEKYKERLDSEDIIGRTAVDVLLTKSDKVTDMLEKTIFFTDESPDPEFQEMTKRIREIRNELNITD